jgi:hypothetical protein
MKKIYFILAALIISGSVIAQPCSNDLPCNASTLTLGVYTADDNSCATGGGEPAVPGCWSAGTVNSLWYSVVCPVSGQLKIKTFPISTGTPLQNTQIAVYSGACGALVLVACNDNAAACGGYTQQNSELNLSGLTAGNTYWIVVDGSAATTGQYEILAINGTGNFPVVPGQDCSTPFPLCNTTTTIGNPGYQVIGGTCDHNGSANCTNGEANSVWYTVNIGAAGNLMFDIVPNDYGNPNPITGQVNPGYSVVGDETDYDWVLWKVTGAGSTTCANIASSGGGGDASCNFSALGVTGLFTGGSSPPAYPGFNSAYQSPVVVAAGEVYVLVIQNYANSTSGFTIQFPVGSPVTFTPSPIVYWTGGANTSNWNTPQNWGGCTAPTCGGPAFDAVITTASSFQPVLTAGVYSVRNLTINPGASLTINAGVTLQICGNFTNNGNLVCQPGSTIEFINGALQIVSGSFTGSNDFYHCLVNKTGGSVFMANDIDISGNFTTNNATSVFNSNNRYVTVSGNFNNFNGNTTYSGTGAAGTLEFNGGAAQTYNQGASQLDLNFVTMNHSGPGVTLLTDMFIKTATGNLTLTNGKIITGGFRVDVANNTPTCVTAGSAASYVFGNLWRTIAAGGGAYNFPVGTATLYERALVTLPGANTYTRLQSRFDTWPGLPNIQGGSECTVIYSLPSENMGYWTINQTGGNTGTYNMVLFANGATNTAGANGWTVEKATSVAGPWTLNGVCAASSATVVNRNGMSGFSVFAVAQAPTPLPVQLTEFNGYGNGEANYLTWTTESEVNNSHFVLQKSGDGVNYSDIERVEGAGNSNTVRNYSAVDENPFGITYYKLRQVDYNGDFSEYGPITISNSNINEFTVHNVYPNPARQSFYIDVYSKTEIVTDLFIYDSYGRMVYGKPTTIDGLVTLEIQSAGWSSGIYTIKIMNEGLGFQFIRRVVIEK